MIGFKLCLSGTQHHDWGREFIDLRTCLLSGCEGMLYWLEGN